MFITTSGFTKVVAMSFVVFFSFSTLGKASVDGYDFLPQYYSQLHEYVSFEEDIASEITLSEADLVDPSVEIVSYVIQQGDTLSHISSKYGTSIETLVTLNNRSNPHRIFPGEELEILTTPGLVHTVQAGETLGKIASSYYLGIDEIIRLSENPKKEVLREGERLVIPGDRVVTLSRSVSGLPATNALVFGWPLGEGTITSPFGWRSGEFHYGLDIAAPQGTPVLAAASGIVTYNEFRGSYGLLVEIDHGNEWTTRYAHNSKALVRLGQRVDKGDVIALVGSTGNSTGPHVHLEIIHRGERLNPEKHLVR